MAKQLITKKAFREWLKTKDPEEQVGLAESPGSCPLATYIKSQGLYHPYVDGDTIGAARAGSSTRKYQNTPQWAVAFIDRVDGVFLGEPWRSPQITAREALACLTGKAGP